MAKSSVVDLARSLMPAKSSPSLLSTMEVKDILEAPSSEKILNCIEYFDSWAKKFYASHNIDDNPQTYMEAICARIENGQETNTVEMERILTLVLSSLATRNRAIDKAIRGDIGKVNLDWYKDEDIQQRIADDFSYLYTIPAIKQVLKQARIGYAFLNSLTRSTIKDHINYMITLCTDVESVLPSIENEILKFTIIFVMALAIDETRKWVRNYVLYKYIRSFHSINSDYFTFTSNILLKKAKIFNPEVNVGLLILAAVKTECNSADKNPLTNAFYLLCRTIGIINSQPTILHEIEVQNAIASTPHTVKTDLNVIEKPHFFDFLRCVKYCSSITSALFIKRLMDTHLACCPSGTEQYKVCTSIMESTSRIPDNQYNAYSILEAISWASVYNVKYPLSFAKDVANFVVYETSDEVRSVRNQMSGHGFDQRYAVRFFCYRHIASGKDEYESPYFPDNPDLKGSIFDIIGEIPLDNIYNVYYVYRLSLKYEEIFGYIPGDNLLEKNKEFLRILKAAALVNEDTLMEVPDYLKDRRLDSLFGGTCPEEAKHHTLSRSSRIALDYCTYPL